MKIFAVKSDEYTPSKTLAWLIYYERAKCFYIEIPENADPWETPLILSSFLKRGEKTVNAHWSKVWVQQRIVPTDRQNLGQILKDNGLKEYDEYALLMLDQGQCAQDEYYLEAISEDEIPGELKKRFSEKLIDVVPIENQKLLAFFRNGRTKKCDISNLLKTKREFAPVYENDAIFKNVRVLPGGYGVSWGDHQEISSVELYQNGEEIPLFYADFVSFQQNRVISSAEAAMMLHCTRQNIENLVRRKKLHPLKITSKNTVFLKCEIEQRCDADGEI